MGRRKPTPQTGLTEALGIRGWAHLDAVLLAALAAEMPVLLVGPHGTAKSLLVERVAGALGLSFRHYNASLLNYDDLVGIPMPVDGEDRLHFVSTSGAIWDAEFAFFDEISRCRPGLQNKLFPIVHERRVAGMALPRLRHRWAAMNPPAPDETEGTGAGDVYIGSDPLDPALVDRFPVVVRVPSWEQLSPDQRRALVAGEDPAVDAAPALPNQVARCAALLPRLDQDLRARLADYVVHLLDLLAAAHLAQTGRRARGLARLALAVHAARLILEGEGASPEASVEAAVVHGLPQTAGEVPPSRAAVRAAHKQAWQVSGLQEGDAWRAVLSEPDPVKRVVVADKLNLCDRDLSRLITQALGAQTSPARRMGLATAMFLSFRDRCDLTPAAWEPLVQQARRVLEPRLGGASVSPGPDLELWQFLNLWLAEPRYRGKWPRLRRNFLMSGFPDFWRADRWRDALRQFEAYLDEFGVREAES